MAIVRLLWFIKKLGSSTKKYYGKKFLFLNNLRLVTHKRGICKSSKACLEKKELQLQKGGLFYKLAKIQKITDLPFIKYTLFLEGARFLLNKTAAIISIQKEKLIKTAAYKKPKVGGELKLFINNKKFKSMGKVNSKYFNLTGVIMKTYCSLHHSSYLSLEKLTIEFSNFYSSLANKEICLPKLKYLRFSNNKETSVFHSINKEPLRVKMGSLIVVTFCDSFQFLQNVEQLIEILHYFKLQNLNFYVLGILSFFSSFSITTMKEDIGVPIYMTIDTPTRLFVITYLPYFQIATCLYLERLDIDYSDIVCSFFDNLLNKETSLKCITLYKCVIYEKMLNYFKKSKRVKILFVDCTTNCSKCLYFVRNMSSFTDIPLQCSRCKNYLS